MKHIARLDKAIFETRVVFDDAVVRDRQDPAVAAQMRMGIFFAGGPVGRPARVPNPHVALGIRFGNQIRQSFDAAHRLPHFQLAGGGKCDDSRAVITSVFQTPQTLK